MGQKDILLKDYFTPDITKSTVTLINELTNSNYVFVDGKERLNMCEAFEGIKAEGIEEGWKEGRKEGIKEGRKAELKDKYKSWVTLSRNLEKKGMSSPEIASSLGISESKLAEAFEYMEHLKEDAK